MFFPSSARMWLSLHPNSSQDTGNSTLISLVSTPAIKLQSELSPQALTNQAPSSKMYLLNGKAKSALLWCESKMCPISMSPGNTTWYLYAFSLLTNLSGGVKWELRINLVLRILNKGHRSTVAFQTGKWNKKPLLPFPHIYPNPSSTSRALHPKLQAQGSCDLSHALSNCLPKISDLKIWRWDWFWVSVGVGFIQRSFCCQTFKQWVAEIPLND